MPRASLITQCPWCRKPLDAGVGRCPHCGFVLRPAGRAGRESPSPLRPAPPGRLAGLRRRLAALSRGQIIAAAVPLALLLAWFFATYSVRSELRRAEAHLEAQTELRDVKFSIPLLAVRMPESVPARAIGLPRGYAYEVKVELRGAYDPATRTAHLAGRKQVLSPYERVVIDRQWEVPPP